MGKRDWLPNETYTTGVLASLSPRTDLVLTWDEVEQLDSTLQVVQHLAHCYAIFLWCLVLGQLTIQHRDGQLLLDRGGHLLLHP